jgi:hypothetical protein
MQRERKLRTVLTANSLHISAAELEESHYNYNFQFAATTYMYQQALAAIKSDADFVAAYLGTVDGRCHSPTLETAA